MNHPPRPNEGIDLLNDLKEVMFPVIWFESSSEVPLELSSPIYWLTMLPTIAQISAVNILIISTLSIFLFFGKARKAKASFSYSNMPSWRFLSR